MEIECPICSKSAHTVYLQGARMDVSCERCGKYCIGIPIAGSRELAEHEKRHILAGAIRNLSGQGIKVEILNLEDIELVLDSVTAPSDPLETIDLLLHHLLPKKGGKASEYVEWSAPTDYPILYARDSEEFKYYIEKARELKLIEPHPNGIKYRLSLKGWRRLAELRKYERKSDQAFVAMWFDSSLDEVWENGFKPALDETGYKPIKINWEEHNEKICDRIIATIRKSGLLVADVTGQRHNVYFEAGFAMGLGITVIWTCHKTDIENLPFDTRQYNHIVWEKSEDLKEKLKNRIEAMPIRPRKGP
jgi:ribosomal protein S27E